MKYRLAVGKVVTYLAITAVAIYLLGFLAFNVFGLFSISPHRAQAVQDLKIPRQGWNPDRSAWFHHTSQGTRIMRLDWFLALEQPEIDMLGTPGLVSEPDYLARFGFLADAEANPYGHGLPVGFAIEEGFQEPPRADGRAVPPYTVVGLTCAGCHTGQVNYHGHGIRIEGGPATIDLSTFQAAVRRSIFFTLVVPGRFPRFAKKVLPDDTPEARQALKAEIEDLVHQGLEDEQYAKAKHLYDLKPGPGRTDALGLIGNRAFADLNSRDNLATADAPVNFPPLWDTPWFDWVQYNASIRPPMVRNIGEALGVGALVNTDPTNPKLYASTVNVKNLHEMEQQIAGPRLFEGLQPPVWPTEVLGELDSLKLEGGRQLFARHCRQCHPLRTELQQIADRAADDPARWVPINTADPQKSPGYLVRLHVVDLEHIGTDPAQALNMRKRVVFTPDKVMDEGTALLTVTSRIRDLKYKELGLSPAEQSAYDGYRNMGATADKNPELSIAANLGYRCRPLEGVWATFPYLHNGSVPNLHELLLPVERRSRSFVVGSRELHTKLVGINPAESTGGFQFDTSKPGNLNTGHEFRNLTLEELEHRKRIASIDAKKSQTEDRRWATVLDVPYDRFRNLSTSERMQRVKEASRAGIEQLPPKGVLGPEFSDDERAALLEYLKSL